MLKQSTGRKSEWRLGGPIVLALAVALTSLLAAGRIQAADLIDPEADEILRSMSGFLGELSSLSIEADVDSEIIDLTGQKLQYSSSVAMTLQRPDKMHVTRRGPFSESQVLFDGQSVTLSVEEPALYAQIPAPGDIDNAIARLRSETGLDAPAGDLFYADPYSGLLTNVTAGVYNGTAFVQGVECHHLVFRAAKVDWQIWIQVGDTPLPMKYIITSKWITGAPQFSIRFRNWNTSPEIDTSRFTFVPTEGAMRLERVPVNAMGELMPAEDQR